MGDLFDKQTRSKIMASIKSKNTKVEILFRKELCHQELKGYRVSNKNIIGNPDIIYSKHKIAIFLDGDFWHGYDWKVKGRTPTQGFWQEKIQRNIDRDIKVTDRLREEGWTVMRFWEHEVKNNLQDCIDKVKSILYEKC